MNPNLNPHKMEVDGLDDDFYLFQCSVIFFRFHRKMFRGFWRSRKKKKTCLRVFFEIKLYIYKTHGLNRSNRGSNMTCFRGSSTSQKVDGIHFIFADLCHDLKKLPSYGFVNPHQKHWAGAGSSWGHKCLPMQEMMFTKSTDWIMHGSSEVIIGHQQHRHVIEVTTTQKPLQLQYKSLSATDLPSLGYVNFPFYNQLTYKPSNISTNFKTPQI